MNYCEDCACQLNNGICSNCQEELYIIENQYEYIDGALSDGFINKAKEQRKLLEDRENY